MIRKRILVIAATVAMAAGVPVAVGAQSSAGAATYGEISMAYDAGYCITTGGGVGTALVLGLCRGAESQEFRAVLDANEIYELQNEDGLCITFDVANGGPDGAPALSGNCVDAQNQLYTLQAGYDGGNDWYMPYRKDSGGSYMAINNQNSVLQQYNPINESHLGSGIPSESWIGPPGVS